MTLSPDNPITLCTPPRVLCADGARFRIAPLCRRLGWRRALVVTDRWFVQHSAEFGGLLAALRGHGVAVHVFDGGAPDPSTTLVDEATQWVAREGVAPDHLIAWGGGSNIDLAKALSVTIPNARPVGELVGHADWPVAPLPLVAVPTTAGTGSEITPGAILVQPGSATKVALMANGLRPAVAVVDPELTLTCPARVTADAGLDALTHAIESWLTKDAVDFDVEGDPDPGYSGRSELTVMFAREATALVFRHLATAFEHPQDRQARRGMARASLYAAMSYATAGLNAVHGLAYALAGLTHASHGSTNAVMLPYVMDALVDVRRDELAEIARLAGAQGADRLALARSAPVLTRELVRRVGIATDLVAFGVAEEDLPRLVADGLAVKRLAKAWPGGAVADDYARIVRHAFHGELSGCRRR
ncbi:iron-containing alcohol dehydrogenase [Azohydromonas sediminis]|uniref:iron-containing alcohol dehydrogenase n=1 Tax=Azohydromonas sediminis TaxID=2259674 RepID=UPI000E657A76|nr:iron-containing alcohol dehydrogenase [Azohydromonas sediminis]